MGLVCWSELRSQLTVSLRGLPSVLVFFFYVCWSMFFSSLREVFWKKHLQEQLSMFHQKQQVVDRFLAMTYDKIYLRVFVF